MKKNIKFFIPGLFLFSASTATLYSQHLNTNAGPPRQTNLILFGRGTYPGDDSTYSMIKVSGFTTIILSSFYIHSDGDVYSGDDPNPIIHHGEFVGNKEWLKRIASLKKGKSFVSRIEMLLEGRWYHQPPNTFDYIKDWTDPSDKNLSPNIIKGTAVGSTLFNIGKIFKETIGADAVCIDDESVYDSESVLRFGEMLGKMKVHITLCPFTKLSYWKAIIAGAQKGLIDAVYLQCYDGGAQNTVAPWHNGLQSNIPVYPIFLCRGAFGTCASDHNSKTPDEIKTQMIAFKKDYPEMSGGAIWQMADVVNYVRLNCAVQDPSLSKRTLISGYLKQLKDSLEEGLQ